MMMNSVSRKRLVFFQARSQSNAPASHPFWDSIAPPPRLYDRLPIDHSPSPAQEAEEDEISMCSLKSVALPSSLMSKITTLLRDLNQKSRSSAMYPTLSKSSIEKYSKYLFKKMSARACSEKPEILGSVALPQKGFGEESEGEKVARRLGVCHSSIAETVDASVRSSATNASDDRHKTFQVVYSPEASLAFLASRFVPSHAVNLRILAEIKRRVPGFDPKRVLDYGAGHAPAALAAIRIFGSGRKFTCIEPSANMSKIGNFLTAELINRGILEWRTALYGSSESYDLILVSYTLMELKTQDQRDLLIQKLWKFLTPGGLLLVVEKGTPAGFKLIHRVRESFLELRERSPSSCHFVAPCPHESACPLALTGRDWCHFSQKASRIPHTAFCKGTRSRAFDLEKYSFLAVRKFPGPRDFWKSEGEARRSLESGTASVNASYFWSRLVMPPVKSTRHTLIDVCSAPGAFERLVVTKSKAHALGYRKSRSAMWGDLWRWPKRLARPDARDYHPEKVKGWIRRKRFQDRRQDFADPEIVDESLKEGEEFLREREKFHYGG